MTNRKFNLTCAIVLMNFILLLLSKISSDQWITVSMGVLTMYIAGNVVQKFKGGE